MMNKIVSEIVDVLLSLPEGVNAKMDLSHFG